MQYAMSWSEQSPNVCINVYPENKNDEYFLATMLQQCEPKTVRLVVQNKVEGTSRVTVDFKTEGGQ